MKNYNLEILFYLRKFGIGVYIDKLPIVEPYKYKFTFQIGWIECCLFFILKSNTWKK